MIPVTRFVEDIRENVTLIFDLTESEYTIGETLGWPESYETFRPLSKAQRVFLRDGVLLTVKVAP